MVRHVKVSVGVPEGPFGMANQSADLWFEGVVVGDGTIRILLSRRDMENVEVRERLFSFAGNTPGLAAAIIAALGDAGHCSHDFSSIEIVVNRRNDATAPINNPPIATESVRRAFS